MRADAVQQVEKTQALDEFRVTVRSPVAEGANVAPRGSEARAGDAVVKHVAALVARTVRSTDLVGRLGGEEFIILVPATNLVAARKLAEKVRARLEANPTPWQTTAIPATASIGIAGCTSAENLGFDRLYNDADKSLYIAKQRGRNQVV